nr:hypothetical protein [Tanacetum cinerariifolium]
MKSRNSKCLDITCPPLKRLFIRPSPITEIKVYAPKLHVFHYDGSVMPSLVFPAIAPAQIKLQLHILKTDDKLFFVNIAEALKLSSEFDIKIMTERFDLEESLEIDMDDLRTRFRIPATNVQHLSVQTYFDKGLWECEHSCILFDLPPKARSCMSRLTVVQIVLWYLDSGCSKHMTGDRFQLTNFVHKFLGKLQPKADIGIFIGYTPTKKALRIYNRRTRRIVETIHVDFDELTIMASEQSSSGPALHEITPTTISSGFVPKPTSSTSFVPPLRNDWDLLFQPLFDELLTPPPSVDPPAPEVI